MRLRLEDAVAEVQHPHLKPLFDTHLGRDAVGINDSATFAIEALPGHSVEPFRVDHRNRTVVLPGRRRFIDYVIAMRMGVSMWHSTEAEPLHLCVITLGPTQELPYRKTAAILGPSGAGKSTLVSRLSKHFRCRIDVEDWGRVDHRTNLVRPSWPEQALHLKRETAAGYGGLIGAYVRDDSTDPERAFFAPARPAVDATTKVDAVIVLGSPAHVSGFRDFHRSDLKWVQAGYPSDFYGEPERWLDGSTLRFDTEMDERRRWRLTCILDSTPSVAVEWRTGLDQNITKVTSWLLAL